MNEALECGAVEQAELVRSGALSARELVEASLRRIDESDPGVNAFVALCPERALAEADAIEPGDARPFCGVPIAIKDLLSATVGLPTTHGSAAFGDWVAGHDSAHVRRLRDAGAIVVGKTNTPELGLRPVTENQRYGVTHNPWSAGLAAGGSSGGSAAAVASGMVGLADGSDLGGSIRIPASCCGVVGLKPSRGRVSIGPDFGLIGLGMPSDGVLTRTVLDAATALDAIAGYEPGDHHFLPPPPAPFGAVARGPMPPTRVHVALRAPLGVPIDREPLAAAGRAADALAALGHEVREAEPNWDDPGFAGVGLVDHLEAAEHLWAFARRLIGSWPPGSVLLTPTLTRLPAEIAGLESAPGVTDDAVRFSALVRIWNVTGQPAISLPHHTTTDGVPVGVQLIGPPGRDDLVLGLAAQLERELGRRPHGIATPATQSLPASV